jgi:hypothetical protein
LTVLVGEAAAWPDDDEEEQAPGAGYRPGRDDSPEELAAFQPVSRFPVIRSFHEIPP